MDLQEGLERTSGLKLMAPLHAAGNWIIQVMDVVVDHGIGTLTAVWTEDLIPHVEAGATETSIVIEIVSAEALLLCLKGMLCFGMCLFQGVLHLDLEIFDLMMSHFETYHFLVLLGPAREVFEEMISPFETSPFQEVQDLHSETSVVTRLLFEMCQFQQMLDLEVVMKSRSGMCLYQEELDLDREIFEQRM